MGDQGPDELDGMALRGWPESWDDSMLALVWTGGARLLRPITDVETGDLL